MRTMIVAALAVASSVLLVEPAQAQGWGDRLKKRAEEAAKRKVEERVERRAGEATDRALNGAEGAARCAAADSACVAGQGASTAAPSAPAPASAAPASAAPTGPAGPAAAAAAERPGTGVWLNYDFNPGERPLFVEDFARDAVGDFPRRLEFKEGNMEVVEWRGSRYLRAAGDGEFFIPLPEVLPERFTIEFDYYGMDKYELKLTFNENVGSPEDQVMLGSWGSGVQGDAVKAMTRVPEGVEQRMVKVRVMADGRYVKVYVDSQRVANVPNANLGRTNKIHVQVPGYEDDPALVGNIRVMAGGRDLYDALSADGRVATQGIYFDTGSDVIRGESTPTLKEIAAMLTEHPELKLAIEGHTDNVGNAAANKALSEKRAAAVKASLVADHGIAADRLTTAGHGDAKPATANATPEGRQQNRRVELVRQ
jgi:outer membrane protein OmpA-like peptidoglycan-associated protein